MNMTRIRTKFRMMADKPIPNAMPLIYYPVGNLAAWAYKAAFYTELTPPMTIMLTTKAKNLACAVGRKCANNGILIVSGT